MKYETEVTKHCLFKNNKCFHLLVHFIKREWSKEGSFKVVVRTRRENASGTRES